MALRHAVMPEPQLRPLLDAYGSELATRRRTVLLGTVLLLAALAASVAGAEVRPDTFWAKLGSFGSYTLELLLSGLAVLALERCDSVIPVITLLISHLLNP